MCLCKENTDPLERRLLPRASVGICPNSYFLSHPFRVEGFPSPGGRDGIGIQFSTIPQPVSDLMGFYSDFAGLPWRIFSEGEEGRTLGRSSLGLPGLLLPPWVPGAPAPRGWGGHVRPSHSWPGICAHACEVSMGAPMGSRGWSLGWGVRGPPGGPFLLLPTV